MKITETKIKDLVIIEPKVFEDDRGYFMESFKQGWFEENFPHIKFIQENESKSNYGVLRGLHFQKPPFEQTKLVRVIQGEVLDVAVDLRKNSPTYGQHESIILSSDNKKQFLVPRGFAHGFIVLSESAIFSYKVDNPYAPDHDSGILWNDSNLNIDWLLQQDDIKLSKKDMLLNNFYNSNEE
ncbi:dTDP-4-dehydrorhamnose 3,5-epimerase [Flammeovirga sp. EKP202]|uniref:dTDP-4-dehydrorhamnose 3,5-epimerase n=1 Tax=Flammeovirga sp. EKP202 TaxID=2770592 RepID=UPI00165FDCAB|nr:dTDP-4-dehydrorhamnose 3,5-epimerase [Flammeovirga sp. EKP202]MBD0404480.1 dTDP-4-dehydrorhamnose 3,5-epimerase [Flammeovirga sp. EKP202]